MYISVDKWGNSVLHRWINEHGREVRDTIRVFRPDLFVPAEHGEFSDMNDDSIRLAKVECGDFAEAKEYIDACARRGIQVYGQNNWAHNAISKLYQGEEIKSSFENLRISVYDLEVMSDDGFPSPKTANKEIVSISHYDSLLDKIYLFSLAEWDVNNSHVPQKFRHILEKIVFIHCANERELLRRYIDFWRANYPMILTGWNTEGFDDPYLFNRISNVLGEASAKSLSPFGAVTKREGVDKFGNETVSVNFLGIAQLDLQRLYQKFEVKAVENYRLGTIAQLELEIDKIDYSEEETLQNLYETDPQKFNDYNILDTWLVWMIECKRQFIRLAVFVAHKAKVNLIDVFSPVKTWDNLIYTSLLSNGRAPALPSRSYKESYPGAYVKSVVPGMYKWIVSFDVASLYPSIIRQWNMCPSTVVDHPTFERGDYVSAFIEKTHLCREIADVDGVCVSANTVCFRTDKDGVLPGLVTALFDERKSSKKTALSLIQEAEDVKSTDLEKYHALKNRAAGFKTKEGAIKVLLNSLYGAMANEYFRFYDIRIAEAITLNGQFIIQFIEKFMNSFLSKTLGEIKDRCIAIDTDSVYFDLSDLVSKITKTKKMTKIQIIDFLSGAAELIQKSAIIPSIEELTALTKCRSRVVDMKREAICDVGFWTAKKKYALNVYDNEGVRYSEPEQKVMGLQLVMSSTPKFCRDKLKEAVKIILTGDFDDKARLVDFIDETKLEFMKLPVYDLSYPRSVNNLEKYIGADGRPVKGAMPNVRAAITYNTAILKMGLDSKYQLIKAGSKIRFVDLHVPNPLKSDVVGFYTRLPEEFGVEKYIDREKIFESTFLSPLRDMCQLLGLLWEPDRSIGDFFS